MKLPFALSSNWRSVSFSKIVSDSAFGPRFSGKSYATDGNVATLRTTDLEEDGRVSYETMPLARLDEAKFQTHFLRHGDLVITRSGTCGIATVFDRFDLPVVPGAFLIRFRLVPDVEPEFYRYFFNSRMGRGHLLSMATGAVQQNLNITNVNKLVVPLPPVTEQQAIVGILSAYDDLIENNTRRIKILEELAQMIYRDWFVNFRFPGHENVRMVDSELGPIPNRWTAKCVTDAVFVNPSTKMSKEGVKPFVPMGSLSDNSMLISQIGEREGSSGAKFQNGDTLFARITPCLENGKTAFVQFLPTDEAVAFGSTEFIVLRSKTVCSEYVYLMARSSEFRDNAIKSMSGATGWQRVQEACFSRFFIAEPNRKTMEGFQSIVSPMFRLIYSLSLKNDNLRTTRDLLLPKLISGEIPVEVADEVAAELVAEPAWLLQSRLRRRSNRTANDCSPR